MNSRHTFLKCPNRIFHIFSIILIEFSYIPQTFLHEKLRWSIFLKDEHFWKLISNYFLLSSFWIPRKFKQFKMIFTEIEVFAESSLIKKNQRSSQRVKTLSLFIICLNVLLNSCFFQNSSISSFVKSSYRLIFFFHPASSRHPQRWVRGKERETWNLRNDKITGKEMSGNLSRKW